MRLVLVGRRRRRIRCRLLGRQFHRQEDEVTEPDHQTTEPPDDQSQPNNGKSEGLGETSESQTEEQRHASVLGLSGKITPAEVKRAYRELLAKYHPDKVNHLGDEFQRIADQRTREIITAYEFMRQKYDIR